MTRGLRQLGLDRSQVDVEILSTGRAGILGFGAEQARVRIHPKVLVKSSAPAVEPSITAEVRSAQALEQEEDVRSAAEVLRTLLRLMSINAVVTVRAPETPGDGVGLVKAILDVRGDDLGILIGRRGNTLASLQYIVNLIVSRKLHTRTVIGIDIEGYRRRREQALTRLALRMADRVKQTGQQVTLEPMPPNERRIVHLALSKDPAVVTNSIGEGESRKVVIGPRR